MRIKDQLMQAWRRHRPAAIATSRFAVENSQLVRVAVDAALIKKNMRKLTVTSVFFCC
jgi:hypothetical protein